MSLSIRAYARHRGVSHVAVMKAIDAGRITQERDGTVNPEQADREWEKNTASPRKRSSMQNQTTEPISEPIQPTLSPNGTSLLQARTVNEVVKAQTNKVRLAQLKGDLVDRLQAITHVFKLVRARLGCRNTATLSIF